MSPKGLFTQIGMIVISIAIVAMFIRPLFNEITSMQDDIAVYKAESGTVVAVNNQLAESLQQLENVTTEDRRMLLTYMPDTVDEIAVQRDLLSITRQSGALYISSQSAGSPDTDPAENMPVQSGFSLSVEGTYGQIKNLLRLLESNHYPLEISNLVIYRTDGGFLEASLELVTYSYQSQAGSNQIVF